MAEDLGRSLLDLANSWIATRDQIVKAREDRAAFFAANQGSHLNFIDKLNLHAAQLGRLLPDMSMEQMTALRELVTSWEQERMLREQNRPRLITRG